MYDKDGRERRPAYDDGSNMSAGAPAPRDESASQDPGYDPTYRPPVQQSQPQGPYVQQQYVPQQGAGGPQYPPQTYGQYPPGYGGNPYPYQAPPPMYAYPPAYAYPYQYGQPPAPVNPSLPMAGGICTIIAASLTLINALFIWPFDWLFGFLFWENSACVALGIIFPVVAILGGLAAVVRRLLPLAIVGAVFGMMTFAFFGLAFVLGLVGLILIAIGHSTFQPLATSRGQY